MSWNYRIVQYKDTRHGFGLHEVFYDDEPAHEPWTMNERPVSFAGGTAKEVLQALQMALKDARRAPVLVEPKKWPTPPWARKKRK